MEEASSELSVSAPVGTSATPLLDRQGLATLVAGSLLILISLATNDCYGDIPRVFTLTVQEQIGLSLHLAALAALFGVDEVFSEGVVELATRLRHRARDREVARERRQNRALRAGALVLLDPSPLNRRFLSFVTEELAGFPPL